VAGELHLEMHTVLFILSTVLYCHVQVIGKKSRVVQGSLYYTVLYCPLLPGAGLPHAGDGRPGGDAAHPRGRGRAAAEERRRGRPAVRPKIIVALTASAFDFEKEACFSAGMNHFLTKPVRPKDLEEMMLVAARSR